FDPITRGHEDLISRALTFADRVVVAVAVNTAKQPLFTLAERVALIQQAVSDPKVDVRSFEGLLADFARAAGAAVIVRGLRAVGADPRGQEAARRLEREELGVVEVLGRPLPVSRLPSLVRHLRARRPDTFPDDAAALAALDHPLTYGACLVGAGVADVMVGGATFPSGDTIRAALWAVGTAPGIATVSGAFYMVRAETVLTFTDCAVVPDPTPE